MCVEFIVGSRPCFEGFSPGSPVFLPPLPNTSKFQFDTESADTFESSFSVEGSLGLRGQTNCVTRLVECFCEPKTKLIGRPIYTYITNLMVRATKTASFGKMLNFRFDSDSNWPA